MLNEEQDQVFKHVEEKQAPPISREDWKKVAEYFYNEFDRRKTATERKEIEKRWEEVDRQVAMTPAEKKRKKWHPKFELPFQANALEVLCAEADQLMFPGNGQFFRTHAQMTDEYMGAFKQDVRFLNGEMQELDNFEVNQESLNEVNQAILMHLNRTYNFQDKIKVSNAEAFKYGTRAMRVQGIKRTTFSNEFNGVLRSESVMPVAVPVSIKDYYPDDLAHKAASHGLHLRPTDVLHGKHRIADLKVAASMGSSDTTNYVQGGWFKNEVQKLNASEADDNNPYVDFIEVEGDLVIPNKAGQDRIAPNMTVTIIWGPAVKRPVVIRVRENPYSFNSIFWEQYFQDSIGLYGISPLMKGESLQKMAQQAAEDTIIVSALQAQPPIIGNHSDPFFRSKGKYDIYPNAQLNSLTAPQVLEIGDLAGVAGVFSQMRIQHDDTTGVNAPRRGAQTKSHQTAYAIESENASGQMRTVAFVRSSERGFMVNILQAKAEIARKSMTDQNIFVPSHGVYVVASGKALAPSLHIEVLGSTTPGDDARRDAKRQQTVQAIVQVEPMAVQSGYKPLNWDYVREKFLGEAFPVADVAKFFADKSTAPLGAPQGGQPGAQQPGISQGGPGVPGQGAGTTIDG